MHDIIIMGSGLAGSCLALQLGKMNLDVILLERNEYPACHLPETTTLNIETVANKIGVNYSDIANCFSTQMIASFQQKNSQERMRIEHITDPSKGPFRVDRSQLDSRILALAIEQGVQHNTGVNVQFCNLDEQPRVVFTELGETKSLSAKIIVDATGKSALLGNQLELKSKPVLLDKRDLIFTHFQNYQFYAALEKNSVHIIETSSGYIFMLPLTDDRISVGVVTPSNSKKSEAKEIFDDVVKEIPWISNLVDSSDPVLPYIKAGSESYTLRQSCGVGYFIVGEALGFCDPFYSNGIETSIDSAALACKAITKLQNVEHSSEAILASYNTKINAMQKNAENLTRDWLTHNGLAISTSVIADPHIPYGISHFLASLTNTDFNTDAQKSMLQLRRKFDRQARI